MYDAFFAKHRDSVVLSDSWNSTSEIMGTDIATGENIHIYLPFSFASVRDVYSANCQSY